MKKLFALLLALAMLMSLVACGDKTTQDKQNAGASSPDDTVYELSAGTVLAADSIAAAALSYWDELVQEKTDGHLKIHSYPGGALGNEKEIYEGMMLGSVDISFCGSAALTSWIPEYMLFDLPLLFTSMEQFNEWAASGDETVAALRNKLNETGIRCYDFVNIGFYHIISNGKAFNDVSTIGGLNVRTLESNAIMALYSNAGANPVSMVFSDVYTSLQNGTVDAAAFPDATTASSQFYQVVEYLTLLNTAPTACPIAISEKTFERLPQEYRDVLEETAPMVADFVRENYDKFEDEALKLVADAGVQIVDPTADEVAAWQAAVCDATYSQYIPSVIDQATIDCVQSFAK